MEEQKPTILLTRELPPTCMETLNRNARLEANRHDRVLSRKELLTSVTDKDGLICLLTDVIDGELLDAGAKLKVVANYAVGFNNIDVAAATARGVMVTNTPGVLTETTADLAWGLVFAVARRIVEGDQLMRSRCWKGWEPMQLVGRDVAGSTLGLVGLGRIGRAMVPRAQGFGMRVVYWNRTRLSEEEENRLGIVYAEFEDLLRTTDFVSLHVALNDETTHLMGPQQFELMKPTAYLINTTRGPAVDEESLVSALKTGQIAGAGLDVYEREPQIEADLYDMANVVLLPHLGSATIETRTKMGDMAVENCLIACLGERPRNLVNPEVLDTATLRAGRL